MFEIPVGRKGDRGRLNILWETFGIEGRKMKEWLLEEFLGSQGRTKGKGRKKNESEMKGRG